MSTLSKLLGRCINSAADEAIKKAHVKVCALISCMLYVCFNNLDVSGLFDRQDMFIVQIYASRKTTVHYSFCESGKVKCLK